MPDIFASLSSQIAHAAEQAAASVVQVHARRRPVAGVAFAEDLVVTPAPHVDEEGVLIRRGDGHTIEGTVLGRHAGTGLVVVRAPSLGVPPARPAPEPKVGHLAVAVGRTWSGGLFGTVTSVAVVGGPLRTGRASEIARVIRVAASPHGALTGGALADGDGRVLGVVTSAAIRGTTVVIPMDLATAAGAEVVAQGGTRQGYLGISSTSVNLPARQRAGRSQEYGLLVTGVVDGGPADAAGLFVGDIIVAFDGDLVLEPEQLVTRLRGDRTGQVAVLSLLRGGGVQEVPVTIGVRAR